MSGESLLTSNYAPEALYSNFEQFLEGHHAMVSFSGATDYLPVYALIRLTRDDVEKGRSVFNWAVKRVCVSMLSDRRFGPVSQEISAGGLHWAKRAEETLGINPAKSIGMVEGIYLLEKLSVWADATVRTKFGDSLAEFRKRPESNEEAYGRVGWLDEFYKHARWRAAEDAKLFVLRRDAAIVLCMAAFIGGYAPTDGELDEVLNQRLPARNSRGKLELEGNAHYSPLVRGSMVSQDKVIEWALGPYQADIPF